jgi:hypothetical protein
VIDDISGELPPHHITSSPRNTWDSLTHTLVHDSHHKRVENSRSVVSQAVCHSSTFGRSDCDYDDVLSSGKPYTP